MGHYKKNYFLDSYYTLNILGKTIQTKSIFNDFKIIQRFLGIYTGS